MNRRKKHAKDALVSEADEIVATEQEPAVWNEDEYADRRSKKSGKRFHRRNRLLREDEVFGDDD